MKSIGGVVLAIVILLAMVTIHEFGHYVAGKLLGFKINEFAVGFGPAIFKKRSKKTGELFALRVIPLGGYCAFDGEDDGDDGPLTEDGLFVNAEERQIEKTETVESEYPEPKGERFNDQPPWKRIIVLIAGATMNYLLALVLILIMFTCVGRPLYKTVVEKPEETAAATEVVLERTEESDVRLQTGDVILKVDGKNVYMVTDYIDALDGKSAGEEVPLLVLRDGVETTVYMVLAQDADFANMSDTDTLLKAMNIYGLYTVTEKQGFFASFGHSFVYSFKIGGTVLRSLVEL